MNDTSKLQTLIQKSTGNLPIEFFVAGLMKGGKTTILKALLEADYLPSNNVAETSNVCTLVPSPNATKPQLFLNGVMVAEGSDAILPKLKQLNDEIREGKRPAKTETKILMKMPFPGSNFVIKDSPGGNEADVSDVTNSTLEHVSTADFLIFVFNYSNLDTNDERDFIKKICETRPDIFQDPKKIVFVVNKIDEKSGGKNENEVLAYLKSRLMKHFSTSIMPQSCVDSCKFIFMSAYQGMQSNFLLSDSTNQQKKQEILEKFDPQAMGLAESQIKQIYEKSGVKELENWIRERLQNQQIVKECLQKTLLHEFNILESKMLEEKTKFAGEATKRKSEISVSFAQKIAKCEKLSESCQKFLNVVKNSFAEMRNIQYFSVPFGTNSIHTDNEKASSVAQTKEDNLRENFKNQVLVLVQKNVS